jgi:hypothetical protein
MSRWRNRRLAGILSLLGIALFLIGLFLPWIIRSDESWSLFQQLVGNPPTPSSPVWWQSVAVSFGPLLLLLLLQVAIALAGLRGRAPRALFAFGLTWALVVLALYLFTARFVYCLGYCSPPPFTPRSFTNHETRSLASGFWLLLGGLLICAGSDLVLVFLSRQRTGSP